MKMDKLQGKYKLTKRLVALNPSKVLTAYWWIVLHNINPIKVKTHFTKVGNN